MGTLGILDASYGGHRAPPSNLDVLSRGTLSKEGEGERVVYARGGGVG